MNEPERPGIGSPTNPLVDTSPASSMSGCGRCGRAQCAGCYIGGPNHPWSERVLDTDGYLADLVKRDEERQQEAAENAPPVTP